MSLAFFSEWSFEYFLRTYELFTDPTIIVFKTIFQLVSLHFALLQLFGCPFFIGNKTRYGIAISLYPDEAGIVEKPITLSILTN